MITTLNKTVKSKKTTKKNINKNFNVGVVMSLTKANNRDILLDILEGVCSLGFHVRLLAEGDEVSQKQCFDLMDKFPENFEILESLSEAQETIINSSDILLCPNKPSKIMIKNIKQQQIVPVVPEGGDFENYDPKTETGNAFTFQENNPWSFFAAIVRASENFQFPYDWKNIQKRLI